MGKEGNIDSCVIIELLVKGKRYAVLVRGAQAKETEGLMD